MGQDPPLYGAAILFNRRLPRACGPRNDSIFGSEGGFAGLEGAGSEIRGGLAQTGFKLAAEVLGGSETAALGDVLHGKIRKFKMLFCHADTVLPQIIHGGGAQLPMEKLGQSSMVQGRGSTNVRQLHGFLIMAFNVDDGLFQGGIIDDGSAVFQISHIIGSLQQQQHFHKIRAAAAGPVPVRLLLQLPAHAVEAAGQLGGYGIEDRENKPVRVGEGFHQKQIVGHRQLTVADAAQLVEGHVDIEEFGVEIDCVTAQVALVGDGGISGFVKADDTGSDSVKAAFAYMELGAAFMDQQQQKTLIFNF